MMSQSLIFQNVTPREFWFHEARDFTPWLAENLSLLAESLNMALEFEEREKSVGNFRADLVCRNIADGSRVVIENQLTCSDHSHLGQVLTYAAGLQATTVIWVAEEFRKEHRATLEWHNEITAKRFRFFGVELRTWRVQASRYVEFAITAKPESWMQLQEPRRYLIQESGESR